jgi:hypothetical protein
MGRNFFLCVGGIFPTPVGAYGKKMKKSCKIGKIFCVWVLKNSYSYDIIDKNLNSIIVTWACARGVRE